jgi:tetratricopeptide (TPR) repeat protein
MWNSKGYVSLIGGGEEKEHLIDAIKDFDEAIKCFKRDKDYEKNDIRYPLYNKGCALYLLAVKYQEQPVEFLKCAITCFDEATKIKPDYVDAWYNEGLCVYSLEREKVRKNRPEPGLKKYKPDLKKYEKAIKCFDEAEAGCRKNIKNKKEMMIASVLYYKGYAHYCLGRNLEDRKNNGDKGNYLDAIQCCGESIEYLDKYLDSPKDHSNLYELDKFYVYFLRGMCKYYYGDIAGAREDFDKIGEEEIDKLGEEEMIDDHQKSQQKCRLKSQKYNNIGVCYYRLGRSYDEDAEKSFIKAIALYSNQSDPYCHLANLYKRQNKYQKAKDILDDAPVDSSDVEKAKRDLGDSRQSDWFNWWFSHSKAKKGVWDNAHIFNIGPFCWNYYCIISGVLN